MGTMNFKTNAKCGGCVTRIEGALQGKMNRGEWNLDLQSPDKILAVNSDKMPANEIVEQISKLGYKIEQIKYCKGRG